MAAVVMRRLQRQRSFSRLCSSLQSGLLTGFDVSSRAARGKLAAPFKSDLQPVSRTSVAAYSSGRLHGHNSASDVHSYNNLISQINVKRRHYLSRDVYEDMLLDGVQPIRDTFYLLITGCMQNARLQDVMFFLDEMKAMGITPDVFIYNCVIGACGKSKQIDRAFQVAEEMESFGIQPKQRTFLALLGACALAGQLDEAYGVVRRMAAYGLTLDSQCYAALITAHKNKKPRNEETVQKIFELLVQSKMPSSLDVKAIAAITGEAEADGDAEDFLLSFMPGDGGQGKRGIRNRPLTVYHAAIAAFQDLGDREAVQKVIQMIEKEGHFVDGYCITQLIKCHLSEGDFEKAWSEYNKFVDLGKRPSLDLYLVMIDGALAHPSPAGSATAQKLLTELDRKGFFLNLQTARDLLSKACQRKTRDIAVANMVWELSHKRGVKLPVKLSREYYKTLEKSGIPDDDPRLNELRSLLEDDRHGRELAETEPGITLPEQGPPMELSVEQVITAEASVVGEIPIKVRVGEQPQVHRGETSSAISPQDVQQ